MKISNFISKELVFIDVEADTIDGLIEDVLNRASVVDEELGKNLTDVKKAVLKREKEVSTALGYGIIIPHGRVENYEDTTVISGTLKTPIKTSVMTRPKDRSRLNRSLPAVVCRGLNRARYPTRNTQTAKVMYPTSALELTHSTVLISVSQSGIVNSPGGEN